MLTPEVNNKFVTQVTLVILDVSLHDFGTYACVAKNPLGESDGIIKLSGNLVLHTTANLTFSLRKIALLKIRKNKIC